MTTLLANNYNEKRTRIVDKCIEDRHVHPIVIILENELELITYYNSSYTSAALPLYRRK
jgi:hypothetical protein